MGAGAPGVAVSPLLEKRFHRAPPLQALPLPQKPRLSAVFACLPKQLSGKAMTLLFPFISTAHGLLGFSLALGTHL